MADMLPRHASSAQRLARLDATRDSATGCYAAFWKRVAAACIDGILAAIASVLCGGPVLVLMMLVVIAEGEEPDPVALTAVFEGAAQLLALFVGWMYFALLESSPLQATLGKLALRIEVTDLAGDRIGFEKATWRYFGKFVSALPLLGGFVMAAFTARRQGLHDRMAGCLVVNRHPPPPSNGRDERHRP